MRISLISRIATITLVIVLVFFATAISWSLKNLSSAFYEVENYGKLKNRVMQQIYIPINTYLDSADATLLTEIENNIASFVKQIQTEDTLAIEVREVLVDLLENLAHVVVLDLRAAGKLADPQVLLMNNENQLLGEIETLIDYVGQFALASAETKQRYLIAMGRMQLALKRLASVRQNYFASHNSASLETMQSYLQVMAEEAKRLASYPPLGVYAQQDEDELSGLLGWDEDTNKEDQTHEHVAEIVSLINRYPKELQNAQRFSQQKIAGRKKTALQMKAMQTQLDQLDKDIASQYQATEERLYIIFFVCLALIVIISVLVILLQRHLAMITDRSSAYINKLANGDLKASFLMNSKIEEVKHLKAAFTKLKGYFSDLINKIQQETSTLDLCQKTVVNGTQNMESMVADNQQLSALSVMQLKQLACSFHEVAANAAETRNVAASAHDSIGKGVAQMQNTLEKTHDLTSGMDNTATSLMQLQTEVQSIEGVLAVIQGFTEQTNLLALNAAIEAARAGEYGRGFAVVADEVRRLASNTATSAEDIQLSLEKLSAITCKTVTLMQEQQKSVAETTLAVNDINQIFTRIYDAISNINAKNDVIAISAEQQASVASSMSEDIAKIPEEADLTMQEAQRNKASAAEITVVCGNLQVLIRKFAV